MKRLIQSLMVLTMMWMLVGVVPAFAGEKDTLQMDLKPAGSEEAIPLRSSVAKDGERYFFLPSGVDDGNVTPKYDAGEPVQIMQSANISSVHFFSADPKKKGRDYVDGSVKHTASAKGTVQIYDAQFQLVYEGDVDALKGRGNTTWDWTAKKPYQMKLKKKADLMDPAGGTEKAKKWLLLSNPFDPTLIRNSMIYAFAKEVGLESTPDGRPVDFYYDGEYRGSYYLCEKVEVGDGRVEIDDLEKETEEANEGVDLESLPTAESVNSRGVSMKYSEGIKNPEDITGGYLMELDSIYYGEEPNWFRVGTHAVVTKSPEYISREMAEYLCGLVNDFHDYTESTYRNEKGGAKLSTYIDMDSFARYFLVNEWFDNNDVWTSSTYIVKPRGTDLLYAGPVWDCDSCMQIQEKEKRPDRWNARSFFGRQLLEMPSFRKAIKEVYQSDFRHAVFDILLGTEQGRYLKPAAQYREELAASQAMDEKLWDINDCDGLLFPEETVAANYDAIMDWMQQRAVWVDEAIMSEGFVKDKVTVNRVAKPKAWRHGKGRCKVRFHSAKYHVSGPTHTKAFRATEYQVAYKYLGKRGKHAKKHRGKKWHVKTVHGKRSVILKHLKKGKYLVRVRAVVRVSQGAEDGSRVVYHGRWSKVKKIRVR